MDKAIVKSFRAEIKSVNEETKTVTAIISHAKKDRDGDIIPPSAFEKRIKRYKDHPVLLVNHDYRIENQIGEAKAIKLNDNHVEATFEYYSGKGNPTADWAFELAKKGLASYSIGFQSYDFDWIEEKQDDGSKKTTGRKFTDIELLEVSQVVVPSNPMALQRMFDLPETNPDEKELCELVLKSMKAEEKAPKPPPSTGCPNPGTDTHDDTDCTNKDMANDAFVREMAEMKKVISEFQQQITEMKGTLLMLVQKVQTLENIETAEDIQEQAEAQAGNEAPPKQEMRSYVDEVLKLDEKTKASGDGADKPKHTPNEVDVDLVSLVKNAFQSVNNGR